MNLLLYQVSLISPFFIDSLGVELHKLLHLRHFVFEIAKLPPLDVLDPGDQRLPLRFCTLEALIALLLILCQLVFVLLDLLEVFLLQTEIFIDLVLDLSIELLNAFQLIASLLFHLFQLGFVLFLLFNQQGCLLLGLQIQSIYFLRFFG